MIAILLSAYNGAKYVSEQIDSLMIQTCQNFKLYIRVDGSADGTSEIVDDYARRFPNKIFRVDRDGNNLGCGQSFMWLLEHTEADYYMYCDQDDIWLPTKIEETLHKMQELDTTGHEKTASVVFTDAIITDENMNVTADSLWKSNHRNPEDARDVYRYAVYRQAALGCTMMFNNEARRLALTGKAYPAERGLHDRLVVFVCAKYGKVGYVSKPLIKYRQHSKNVTSFQKITNEGQGTVARKVLKNPLRVFNVFEIKFGCMNNLPFHISKSRLFFMLCWKWIMPNRWN